jgi:hypothetical protein
MLRQKLREDHMQNIFFLFYLRIWYAKYFRHEVTSPPPIMMWIWAAREPLVMQWSGRVLCGLKFRCLVVIFCARKIAYSRWVNDNYIICNYLWFCVNRVQLNSLWNIQKLLCSSWWTRMAVLEESAERRKLRKGSLTLFAIVSDIFALQFGVNCIYCDLWIYNYYLRVLTSAR